MTTFLRGAGKKMTISMSEIQLKKIVNTAVADVLSSFGFDKKKDRLNSPSARHYAFNPVF